MKNKFVLAAVAALTILGLASPAQAVGGTTVTFSATNLAAPGYVTVTVNGPVSFTTNNSVWNPTNFTGDCKANIVGSYTNPPQHVEGSCATGGTLTGWSTYGTQVLTFDNGQTVTLTAAYVAPVGNPSAPAPSFVENYTTVGGTYLGTITNVGNLSGTANYVETVYNPSSLSKISAPAFTSCTWRIVRAGHRLYQGNGFVCYGAVLAPGESATVTVTP